MPDQYGFDRLGDDVRCIEPRCGAGGPVGQWPEPKRQSHFESHGHAPTASRAPVDQHGDGERSFTMAEKKVSGRDACVAVLKAAGKPMTAGEIADAVLASGMVPSLKGKTPKATLSAQITSGAKAGRVFKKVGSTKPQKFTLRDDAPDVSGDLVEALRGRIGETTQPAAAGASAAGGGKQEARPDPKPGGKAAAAK